MAKKKKTTTTNSIRISLLVLLNALIFYSFLSNRMKIQPLNQINSSKDPASELVKNWEIINKDGKFASIFQIAKQILQCYNWGDPGTTYMLKNLITTAQRLTENRSAYRQDLMGRIFHKLLPTPKYVGTFFTKIQIAALLVGLSFRTRLLENIDWTDPGKITEINVADIACGSGTLLKAVLDSFVEKHTAECIKASKNHQAEILVKKLIEQNIHGYDIFTSNVHIAAVTLAVHYGDVKFEDMHLHPMPIGSATGDASNPISLGSLSFFAGKQVSVGVQQTLSQGTSIGPKSVISGGRVKVELPDLHFSIMNPPFTRPAPNARIYYSIPNEGKVNKELSRLVRVPAQTKKMKGVAQPILPASLVAGLGSLFIAGVSKKQRKIKDAVQAIVIPKNILSGVSWKRTRDDLLEHYNFKYIVSSFEPGNENFSESTSLSEVLLVAENKIGGKDGEITYFNLWKQPTSTFDTLTLLTAIDKLKPAGIAGKGTCSLNVSGTKYGELLSVPQKTVQNILQLPANFAQTDMVRIARNLYDDKIFVPTKSKTIQTIKTIQVGDCFELGPDGRDVKDGYNESQTTTNFPAFYGRDSGELKRIRVQPNIFLEPRTVALAGRNFRDPTVLWKRAGTLLLPKTFAPITNPAFAVRTPNNVLSNVFWVSQWKKSDKRSERQVMERRAVLWFNSTLGLVSILSLRSETGGTYFKFSRDWWANQGRMVDLSILSPKDLAILDKCWNDVHNKDILPYSNVLTDPVRKKIDGVWCKILKIKPEDLEEIKTTLAREPMFTGKTIT